TYSRQSATDQHGGNNNRAGARYEIGYRIGKSCPDQRGRDREQQDDQRGDQDHRSCAYHGRRAARLTGLIREFGAGELELIADQLRELAHGVTEEFGYRSVTR